MTDDIDAVEAALKVLRQNGIDVSSPRDGDLDDLEQERFNAVADACRAYAARRTAHSSGAKVKGLDDLAAILWRTEAEEVGAPAAVAKARTRESFDDQGDGTKETWRKFARAARQALSPAEPGVDDGPISQAEMVGLFGSGMPIEALKLLYDAPDDWTCADVRRELRKIAAAGVEGDAKPVGYIDRHRQKFASVETHDAATLSRGGWTPVYTHPSLLEECREVLGQIAYNSVDATAANLARTLLTKLEAGR